jgi:hypothetical protein
VIAALIRAVDEFGLDGPIQDWLRRVDDWSTVEWEQVASVIAAGARSAPLSFPADRGIDIAA